MPGLPLSLLDFARYKEIPHGATPGDISLLGRVACPEMPHRYWYRNVPKCPKVMGGKYRRTADRLAGWQGDTFSVSCKRL